MQNLIKIKRKLIFSISPGIIEGAAQGKGRGRQVIAVARTADLVIMMLDATKPNVHRDL